MIGCAAIILVLLVPPFGEGREPLQAKAFPLKRYSAELAVVKLWRALGEGLNCAIAFDRETNQIFVRATSTTLEQVETILNRLDVARPNCLLQFIRLKHVPATLACQTTDFFLLLLAVIDGDDDPIYLTPETRINGVIMSGGTWERWRQVAFFLHLLDRNPWGLYNDGLNYLKR